MTSLLTSDAEIRAALELCATVSSEAVDRAAGLRSAVQTESWSQHWETAREVAKIADRANALSMLWLAGASVTAARTDLTVSRRRALMSLYEDYALALASRDLVDEYTFGLLSGPWREIAAVERARAA